MQFYFEGPTIFLLYYLEFGVIPVQSFNYFEALEKDAAWDKAGDAMKATREALDRAEYAKDNACAGRIVLVNNLLKIGFSPALPSSSISASSFDLNNYTLHRHLASPYRLQIE